MVGSGLRRLTATVRFRITVLATVLVLVVLVLAGSGLAVAQHRLLTENAEEGLAQTVAAIERTVAGGSIPSVLGAVGDDDAVAQVIDPSDAVIAATPNIAGRPPIIEPATARAQLGTRTLHDVPVDDADFRALARTAPAPAGPDLVLAAVSLGDVEQSTRALVAALAIGIPVTGGVLAALVWWLIGRTLRPVEALRAEVSAIGPSELHRRVPQPSGEDEIARLARTMNAMLERVDRAAQRQDRFVADASHELRSPLTRIRTELEVDDAQPDWADRAATHSSILDETIGLQQLVEDLLQLARSDAGGAELRPAPVDLDDLVLDQARRLRAQHRVRVDTSGVGAAQLVGDAHQLTRAIANLVDNAARHATSTVEIAVRENDGTAVVTVTDDGPGIPGVDHDRVFERFTRLDAARADGTGGTGLGLAIARDIAHRHGGTLTIDPDHHPGARFVLALPTHRG